MGEFAALARAVAQMKSHMDSVAEKASQGVAIAQESAEKIRVLLEAIEALDLQAMAKKIDHYADLEKRVAVLERILSGPGH